MESENTNYIEVTLDETVLKQLGYDVEYEEDCISDLRLISFKKNGEDVTDLVIPSTYSYNGKNYKITKIGKCAFGDCSSLTSVTIPDTITIIGESAFCGCKSLISVTLPDNITEIDDWAFADCSSLKDVKIPNNITQISEGIFSDCSLLISVTIPDGVTKIGESAFSDCSSLTSIVIPNSVAEIDKEAFANCLSLTSLEIPDSVIEIGDNAFYKIDTVYYNGSATGSTWGANKVINNNYDYVEVTLNETVLKQLGYDVEYKEDENGELDYYGDVFKYLVSFRKNGQDVISFNIPKTYIYNCKKYKITQIEKCAFDSCESLKNVVIPDSVDYIGDWAFNGIPHIEYHGTATGAPWGAKEMN